MRRIGKVFFVLIILRLGLAVGVAGVVDVEQPWAVWLKERTRADLWGPVLGFFFAAGGVWAVLRRPPGENKVQAVQQQVESLEKTLDRKFEAFTAAQTAQIEMALAVADQRQKQQTKSEGPQPRGADAKETLRHALEDYLRSDDPRGAQVPELVADGRTQEAQAIARQIAEDLETEQKRLAAADQAARAKAAKAWADAGAIAYLNDPQAALAACERAHVLGDNSVGTLIWLGLLNWRLGRLDKAVALPDRRSWTRPRG